MYYVNNEFANEFVIIIAIHNVNFSTCRFFKFDEIEFEKTIAFFIVDVSLTLIFFKFRFVRNVTIANKRDFIYFFNEFVDV